MFSDMQAKVTHTHTHIETSDTKTHIQHLTVRSSHHTTEAGDNLNAVTARSVRHTDGLTQEQQSQTASLSEGSDITWYNQPPSQTITEPNLFTGIYFNWN